MKKLRKIYVKFNLYLDRNKITRRNIDFGFIFNQSFFDGFSDLIQKDKFDWFNNRWIMNKDLSLKQIVFTHEKEENLKKYYSIYDIEKIDDIQDILNFLEEPTGIITVRPIFFFKGGKIKSMNFLTYPFEESLYESQLKARGRDIKSLTPSLIKKEIIEKFNWDKMDAASIHTKGMSYMDCCFNLNDPAQVKRLFDSEFWLKFARKSLRAWRKL